MMPISLRKIGLVSWMLGCFFTWSSAQTDDYDAKSSIIQGIEAFDAGESSFADSLFARGESHSELAAMAAYNQGRHS